MEKHKNLSIFVPHEGCPNRCSFCDQKKISGTQNPPSPRYVTKLCDEFLPRDKEGGRSYEIAFFGGSFTAIKRDYMLALLQAAYPFVKEGRAAGIRVSTRPDAINREILDILKVYGVTSVELGAQSMQDEVLNLNLRGHTVRDVYDASRLIKEYGFSLGLQMMPGLYGQKDYMEYSVDTAKKFIEIKPDTVRIYPTLVLKDTLLESLYQKGMYTPLTVRQAVEICAVLVKMFNRENIRIIKLGLHADTGMEKSLVAGPYHPALKELVQSFMFLERLKEDFAGLEKGSYTVAVNGRKRSQLAGQKKAKVEDRPGVTRTKQWVKLSDDIELLDMPGVLWPKFEDMSVGEKLAFTGAVKDDVVDIETLACRLLYILNDLYKNELTSRFKIETEENEDGYELLKKVGKARGMLISGGEINTERAAITVLDEFRGGKLGRITLELP
ncbi:MAG: radical SAM protein [Oscillospiraceae bacterium]